jgi:hypothetical protein
MKFGAARNPAGQRHRQFRFFHGAKGGAVCGKEMAKTRISHKLMRKLQDSVFGHNHI